MLMSMTTITIMIKIMLLMSSATVVDDEVDKKDDDNDDKNNIKIARKMRAERMKKDEKIMR